MPVLQYHLTKEAKDAGVAFKIPRELDAGFDIACSVDTEIAPKSFALIETGLHLAIPENWVALLRDRSSVALRGGVVTAGVIDASYRGEVKIAMHNLSDETLSFKCGERVAQALVIPHLPGSQSLEAKSLETLGETERGAGGFGSTGK